MESMSKEGKKSGCGGGGGWEVGRIRGWSEVGVRGWGGGEGVGWSGWGEGEGVG